MLAASEYSPTGKKTKRIKKLIIPAVFILIIAVTSVFAFRTALSVKHYKISADKISDNIRIAFLADLHSSNYGEGQKELLDCINKQAPDIILFGGDIADDKLPHENWMTVLEKLAASYPCYFVTGNHEYWSSDAEFIRQTVNRYGINILEGECSTVSINGQKINICGIDDFVIGEKEYNRQLKNTIVNRDISLFSILLAHRPEHINRYLNYKFDLILSGHTHGGQWRIPFILNGLFAPDQGFFPKYAGGKYKHGSTLHIVSRGLSKNSTRIPRIFNPPELVIVDLY
jgi:predicted MPP superfamily phosphohydrolase